MYFYGLDPLYLMLMLPVMLFSIWAQFKVKSSFKKYSQIGSSSGYSGADVARIILEKEGITNVKIDKTSGWLSDHYSPTDRVLRLSSDVYGSSSISAIGVAAHEAGHTIQHHRGIAIMKLWLALAKPAAIASNASIWLIIIGMLFGALNLAKLGLLFFAGAVVFQIITLPLEFDASSRAKKLLYKYGIISNRERKGVAAVLNSAAMTYVAAAVASLVQLLYFAIRLGLLGGGDD